jgi:hypothetical protein
MLTFYIAAVSAFSAGNFPFLPSTVRRPWPESYLHGGDRVAWVRYERTRFERRPLAAPRV